MLYKLIIFDFDGTLTSSMDVAYKVYQMMAQKYRLTTLTKPELLELKALPLFEKLRVLGISLFDIPKLTKESQKLVRSFLEETQIYPGMKELVSLLKDKGYLVAIISSNIKRNIYHVLKHHQFLMFDKIIGKAKLFEKHVVIQALAKKKKISLQDVLYIGDEVRDIHACQKINVDVAAVSWGFDDPSVLLAEHPTYLVHEVVELKNILLGN
jgi:phosphoglycolate phosphatase